MSIVLVISYAQEILMRFRDQYVIMPVISICSRHRHTDIPEEKNKSISPRKSATNRATSRDSNSSRDLDLHTSEGHIPMTNSNLTISQTNFNDCIIDNVLDIYVVERIMSNPTAMDAGKDGIFTLANHWVF